MKTVELKDGHSVDVVAENIERMKDLFPDAFSEGSVNFDNLRQLLGDAKVLDEGDEKYGLNWHGKKKARQIALTPSPGTLLPCPDESVDWDTTKNIFIEGDNLEVLKLLQKSYANSIDVIYIDPPYNTDSDFIYPDKFSEGLETYLRYTGQKDYEGEWTVSFSGREKTGRKHTNWLSMIMPRIKLARSLMNNDGVILISIDENEVDNLQLICNELLGEENFVAKLIWEKGRKNDAKLISNGHDYILVYVKNKASLQEKAVLWREAKPGAAEIHAEYLKLKNKFGSEVAKIQASLKEFYTSLPKDHPSKKLSRYGNVDIRGVWRDDNMSWPGGGGPTYDVIHPETNQPCKVPEGGWRYSTLAKMEQMILEGKVAFREDHSVLV
jgi:adenine-specific DNA-methyltransferase